MVSRKVMFFCFLAFAVAMAALNIGLKALIASTSEATHWMILGGFVGFTIAAVLGFFRPDWITTAERAQRQFRLPSDVEQSVQPKPHSDRP